MRSLLLVFLFVTSAAFGMTASMDCGKSFGSRLTLTIETAPEGSFYAHRAVFTAPSADATTGTLLRSVIRTFEGDKETYEGKKYFHMANPLNPVEQLIIEVPRMLKQKIEVADLNIKKKTEKNYRCKVLLLNKD